MKYALFIDINNEKNDYVCCSHFIEEICKRSYNYSYNQICEDLYFCRSFVIKEPVRPNLILNKLEEPLIGYSSESSATTISEDIWADNPKDYFEDIHFHIRVNFYGYNNLDELHYLAILINNLKNLVKEGRLSVFLEPTTGDKYPYEFKSEFDQNIYFDASKKLRCLIGEDNKGVIFGASHKKSAANDNIVEALDFNLTAEKREEFPIIIFNSILNSEDTKNENDCTDDYIYHTKIGGDRKNLDINNVDNYSIMFSNNNVVTRYIQEAMKLKTNGRFGFADSVKPNIAISDFLFETAFFVVRKTFENCNYNIKDFEEKLLLTFNRSNIFCFLIFSFIFNPTENESKSFENEINKCYSLSNEITEGLNQIIQNSIQHSSKKFCVVSIKNINDYLNIIVSDISDKSIEDTFKYNLQNEIKYLNGDNLHNLTKSFGTTCYYKDIRKNSDALINIINNDFKLKYFFNDFDNDKNQKEAWFNFRQADSSAHIGLSIFVNELRKCNANFFVQSSNDYRIFENSIDQSAYTNNSNRSKEECCYFSGTEFIIQIPTNINLVSNNLNNLSNFRDKGFVENYDSYSKYLDYNCKNILKNYNQIQKISTPLISNYVQTDKSIYENKFKLLIYFTNYWLNIFSEISLENKKIFLLDAKSKFIDDYIIESNYNTETFIKGFINALEVYKSSIGNHEFLLSIINLDSRIFNMFINITSAVSFKLFPPNMQLFICTDESASNKQVHLIGHSYANAVQNAYLIALENGSVNYDGNTYYKVQDLTYSFEEYYGFEKEKLELCPFLGIIGSNDNYNSMFFDLINNKLENEMTSFTGGYKISDCHMRLGNKIHINSFYEMSYLFYRTIISNHVAFYILRDLINNSDIDLVNDNIIFYGYASYSQAILMSLIQMLKFYRNKHKSIGKNNIFYSIYQYNLQYESNAENIKIYTNDEKGLNKIIANDESVKVIQIVPISSTMTTFSKTWLKLNSKYKNIELFNNYTVFWVRDTIGEGEEITELEEDYYFAPIKNYVTTKFNALNSCNKVKFIIEKPAKWELPEKCEKCFPDDIHNEHPLIETDQTSTIPSQQIEKSRMNTKNISWDYETQKRIASLLGFVHYGHYSRGKNHHQIYVDTQGYFNCVSEDVKEWLSNLCIEKTSVDYPCIDIIFSPIHNTNVGFSQYVNAYFFGGSAEIISINEDKEYRSNFICEHSELINNINKIYQDYLLTNQSIDGYRPVRFTFVDDNIVTGLTYKKACNFLQELLPEELLESYTTNVFDMCFVLVNRLSKSSTNSYVLPNKNFYAYCQLDISNTRIQGDSCTCCKLLNNAQRLYKRSSTYLEAEYWLKKYKKLCDQHFNTITNNDNDDKNKHIFNSYLRASLSHILKTYLSFYKNDDKYLCFIELFDFFSNEGKTSNIKVDNKCKKQYLKDSYMLVDLKKLQSESKKSNQTLHVDENLFDEYIENITQKDYLKALFKVITRPFFTYNFLYKKDILKFMINLCEYIFNMNSDNEYSAVYKSIVSVFNHDPIDFLEFLKEYIFEGLTDLNSTYLLRKSTIINTIVVLNNIIENNIEYCDNDGIKNTIKNFLDNYCMFVQRLIDSEHDETRALWFEHMIITGEDKYEDISNCVPEKIFYNKKSLYEIIKADFKTKSSYDLNEDLDKYICSFCDELFFLNSKIQYDGISHLVNTNKDSKKELENYFVSRWQKVREIDNWLIRRDKSDSEYIVNIGSKTSSSDFIQGFAKEIKLHQFLTDKSQNNKLEDNKQNTISFRYKSLLSRIKSAITSKYNIPDKKFNIALLTFNKNKNYSVRDFEIVESDVSLSNSETRMDSVNSNSKYIIKKRVCAAQTHFEEGKEYYLYNVNEGIAETEYLNNQYKDYFNEDIDAIDKAGHRSPYFVLKFSNEYIDNETQIVPVYLYVSIIIPDASKRHNLSYLVIRDIMSYRYDLIKFFSNDFTSDVMQRYSYYIDIEDVSKNEKIMSHTSMSKDKEELEKLIDTDKLVDSKPLLNKCSAEINKIQKLSLARNYCNTVIARLYNRVFRNINKNIIEIIKDNEVNKLSDYSMLYMEHDYHSERNEPLSNIKQVIPLRNTEDVVFQLLSEIITFDVDISSLKNIKPLSRKIQNDSKNYVYNLDFVKSIIYRICFDALRFSYGCKEADNDFVFRVANHFIEIKNRRNPDAKKYMDTANDVCYIKFFIEECNESNNFDWLVISNHVYKPVNDNIGFLNKKMEDPIDFSDGHMSLIAVKEYFSLLLEDNDKKIVLKKIYQYSEHNGKNYFETRLPLIKKGEIDYE